MVRLATGIRFPACLLRWIVPVPASYRYAARPGTEGTEARRPAAGAAVKANVPDVRAGVPGAAVRTDARGAGGVGGAAVSADGADDRAPVAWTCAGDLPVSAGAEAPAARAGTGDTVARVTAVTSAARAVRRLPP
ncbi:hypothetical protein GCM10018952_68040 [Streptosporangium vulgare]